MTKLTPNDVEKVRSSILWTYWTTKARYPWLPEEFAFTIAAMVNEEQNPRHSYNRAGQILGEHPMTISRRMKLIARAYGGDLAELKRKPPTKDGFHNHKAKDSIS